MVLALDRPVYRGAGEQGTGNKWRAGAEGGGPRNEPACDYCQSSIVRFGTRLNSLTLCMTAQARRAGLGPEPIRPTRQTIAASVAILPRRQACVAVAGQLLLL